MVYFPVFSGLCSGAGGFRGERAHASSPKSQQSSLFKVENAGITLHERSGLYAAEHVRKYLFCILLVSVLHTFGVFVAVLTGNTLPQRYLIGAPARILEIQERPAIMNLVVIFGVTNACRLSP
jgi:hypothetical protein